MKINIVTGPFHSIPPGPTGAIEKIWYGLAKEMVVMGHHVSLICPKWDDKAQITERDGIRLIPVARRKRSGSTLLDIIVDAVHTVATRNSLPSADITVTNSFCMPLLLQLLRKRVGLINLHHARFPKRQMGIYRGVDRICSCSTAVTNAICKQSPGVSHLVKYIPNPVDTTVFSRQRYDVKDDPPTLLFTGRVHPEKGLDILVEAWNELLGDFPDLRLRLIGPTCIDEGGGGEKYLSQLGSLGAGDIEFVPPIRDPKLLANEICRSTVYCYPSVAKFGEASPVAPLEAMACGVVTVVSDLEQFRGYLVPDITGLIFPHAANDRSRQLANQIRRVLCDDQLRNNIETAAISMARQFSFPEIAKLYLEDFDYLLKRKQRLNDCNIS